MNVVKILALGLLAPSLVFAQATSTINIVIEAKSIQDLGDGDGRINLLAETLKQYPNLKTAGNLEFSAVTLDGKSGAGGAQVFLRVNNAIVDGAVIETNSDLKNTADVASYKKIELKNIDRSQMAESSLQLQNAANMRIKNIQIVLGKPQEPAIFGHYADQQVSQIGGGVAEGQADEKMITTPEQVAAVYEKYYGEVVDVDGAAATLAQAPVSGGVGGDCLVNSNGPLICLGGTVSEKYQGQGVVTSIGFNTRGSHQIAMTLGNGRSIYTMLSQVTVLESGASRSTGSKVAPACVGNICVNQNVSDRTGQALMVRDIQTYRGSVAVIAENRYGQGRFYAENELIGSGNGRSSNQEQTQTAYNDNRGQQQSAVSQVPPQGYVYNPKQCVSDKRSRQTFCIGMRVAARTSRGLEDGVVIAVKNKMINKDTVDVRLDMGGVITLKVDEVFKR